ncbi:Paxillin [Bagarius yarrelli]|uniref:Paxillin n=1 Tax=Bagarius yarrelli TaxID=175774 RepID=A0A556VU94_BAGYA|nr:Paxillin [Bagarius yarrelli]
MPTFINLIAQTNSESGLLDALLADLESSTTSIPKCPVFLPDETPYSFPSGGGLFQEDTFPPPVPPPPSTEALNGSLQKQPESHHSSRQSLGSAPKSTLSQDSSSPQLIHAEEDHVYSFPNKQKTLSESSAIAMSAALGSNLSELDRLLLELNAVQQNTPSYSSTDAAPPLPPSSSAHYIQENEVQSNTPAVTDKAQRNINKGPEEGRPTVESLLDELESSIPVSMPSSTGLQTEGHLDVTSEQQGRMSATSATRELDELMACLSDFKVQSNPTLLGSLNSEPLLDQCDSFSANAEIHSPSAKADPTAGSPALSLPSKPNSYSPLPSHSVPLELHIMEDFNDTIVLSGALTSAPLPLHCHTTTSAPFPSLISHTNLGIIDSVSMPALSQAISTTTTSDKESFISLDNQQHTPAAPYLSPSSLTNSALVFSVPSAKNQSPVTQPGDIKNIQKDSSLIIQASNDVCLVTKLVPENSALSPLSTSPPVSPIKPAESPCKTSSRYITSTPISLASVPNTSDVLAVLPESFNVATPPLSLIKPEATALCPSPDN